MSPHGFKTHPLIQLFIMILSPKRIKGNPSNRDIHKDFQFFHSFFSPKYQQATWWLRKWRWRVGDGGTDGTGEGCTNASLSQPHWRWSNRAKPHAKSSQQTRRDDADGWWVMVGGGCCWVEVLEAWATALQLLLMFFQLGFDRELGIWAFGDLGFDFCLYIY